MGGLSVAIVFASFFDTFPLSGYFTYGGAISAAALAGFSQGMRFFEVVLLSVLGIIAADLLAVSASRLTRFSVRIQAVVEKRAFQEGGFLSQIFRLQHLSGDGMATRFLKLICMRFLAITRPINAILFFSAHRITFVNVIILFLVNVIWVVFWASVFYRASDLF